MVIDITLTKAKYRPSNFRLLKRQFDPEGGTKTVQVTRFVSKTMNSGSSDSKKVRTLKPRQRAYGPF